VITREYTLTHTAFMTTSRRYGINAMDVRVLVAIHELDGPLMGEVYVALGVREWSGSDVRRRLGRLEREEAMLHPRQKFRPVVLTPRGEECAREALRVRSALEEAA
jgi:DNA-binding MarR family transcriptional regulator